MIIRVSKNPQFWLMMTGKVVLMVVGQFISFIPLFLKTGLKMESHKAASASSVFSLGSLLASIIGARMYKNLKPKQQIDLVLLVNIVSSFIGIFFTIQTFGIGLQIPLLYSLCSLFLWGATWALAFYTPPGIDIINNLFFQCSRNFCRVITYNYNLYHFLQVSWHWSLVDDNMLHS